MSSWKQLSLGLIALSFIGSFAFAGNEGSGGGNAIVCFDSKSIAAEIKADKVLGGGNIDDKHIPHIISVELLDIHKAQIGRLNDDGEIVYPKIINSLPGETASNYRKRIISRFEKLMPEFAGVLKEPRLDLPVKAFPHGIAPIDDIASGEMFPANCVRSTIIAQFTENINDIRDCESDTRGYYKPDFSIACSEFNTYIAIDQRIYNLPEQIFPTSSRVLSYWHEYFYYIARYNQKVSRSDSVQSLIGSLITEDSKLQDIYKNLVRAIGRSYYSRIFQGRDIYRFYFNTFITDLLKEIGSRIQDDDLRFKTDTSMPRAQIEKLQNEAIDKFTQKVLKIYLENYRPSLLSMKEVPKEILQRFDSFLQNHWIIKDGFNASLGACNRTSKYSLERTCIIHLGYNNPSDFDSFISKLPKNEQFNLLDFKLPNAD